MRLLLLLVGSVALAHGAEEKCLEAGTVVHYPTTHKLRDAWCSTEKGVWKRKKDGCVWKCKSIGGDEKVYCKTKDGKWAAEEHCLEKGTVVEYPSKHTLGATWCSSERGVWTRKADGCVWKKKDIGGDEKVHCQNGDGSWVAEAEWEGKMGEGCKRHEFAGAGSPAACGADAACVWQATRKHQERGVWLSGRCFPKSWGGRHHHGPHGKHGDHHHHHPGCKLHEFKGASAEKACGADKACVWKTTPKHVERGVTLTGRCFPAGGRLGGHRHHHFNKARAVDTCVKTRMAADKLEDGQNKYAAMVRECEEKKKVFSENRGSPEKKKPTTLVYMPNKQDGTDGSDPGFDKHPYIYESRAQAQKACVSAGYKGLCTRAQVDGHERCAAGWMSDFKGYWMSKTATGCGTGKGMRGWGAGKVGAYCCGDGKGPDGGLTHPTTAAATCPKFARAHTPKGGVEGAADEYDNCICNDSGYLDDSKKINVCHGSKACVNEHFKEGLGVWFPVSCKECTCAPPTKKTTDGTCAAEVKQLWVNYCESKVSEQMMSEGRRHHGGRRIGRCFGFFVFVAMLVASCCCIRRCCCRRRAVLLEQAPAVDAVVVVGTLVPDDKVREGIPEPIQNKIVMAVELEPKTGVQMAVAKRII